MMKIVGPEGQPVPGQAKNQIEPENYFGFCTIKAPDLTMLSVTLNRLENQGKKDVKVIQVLPYQTALGGVEIEAVVHVRRFPEDRIEISEQTVTFDS